jgi:hypothetical protein
MDKLRLSLRGSLDFARLYDWTSRGFGNGAAAISLPCDQTLKLFFSSVVQYELTIEGDASLQIDDFGGQFLRFYFVDWSNDAKQRGSGKATVKVSNPNFPHEPFAISLTLGEFSYEHTTRQTTPTQGSARRLFEVELFAEEVMMAEEQAHAVLEALTPSY